MSTERLAYGDSFLSSETQLLLVLDDNWRGCAVRRREATELAWRPLPQFPRTKAARLARWFLAGHKF